MASIASIANEEARAELDSVEAELELLELQISELLEKQASLTARKNKLLKILDGSCDSAQSSGSAKPSTPVFSKKDLQHYEESDFSWSKEVEATLANVFQLSKFRPLQRAAVNLSMSGRDLFLVMPTGRGKSLCYQLPAVCSNGFTLVITPLVSLMEDQLMYLKSINIPAVSLNASSSKEDSKYVMAGMIDKNSPFKLLYVTPEKIAKSKLLMSKLEKAYNMGLLKHIAVDEVHCCSQWGHDFRPDYKLLGILKRQFPKVQLIGLTATATSSVLKDCQKILCVQDPIILTAPFNRPNLYYEVRYKNSENSTKEIAALIKGKYKDQSGIIYVFSQKDAEMVSTELQQRGILAQPYHANMEPSDKTLVHHQWSRKNIQVVVATVAFGMGIDKADVRFVIHHTISKSMENYYQESGRAGRDDGPADCIVFYGFADIFRISTLVVMDNTGQQKLQNIVAYCQNVDRCRRAIMAVHFDEVWDDEECNQTCDVCRHGSDYITMDITKHAREVMDIIQLAASLDEKMTPLKVCDTWMGKGNAKIRKMAKVTTLSRLEVESIIVHLLLHGYFSEDFSFTPYTTYCYLKAGRKAGLLKNENHSVTMKMRRKPEWRKSRRIKRKWINPAQASEAVQQTAVAMKRKRIKRRRQRRAQRPYVQSSVCSLQDVKPVFKSRSYRVKQIDQSAAAPQEKTHRSLEDINPNQSPNRNPIETDSDQPNPEMRLFQNLEDFNSLQAPESIHPPVIEVKVNVQEPKSVTKNMQFFNKPTKPPLVPSKRRPHQISAQSVKSALPSFPSETSIISAAGLEELCDLRSYYSKQLRRINTTSHEQLQESAPGVLTCIREPLRSLRLPSSTTIAKSARNLWTRVSIRRKLIHT
ncbi:ATP-dependent DNA helicase Q1 [Bagarius yarrelli]|uniref:ATP-dependent DNA helicase n=1 Tax=Bagarius yarrelli TaxID=175774 RepID=A0A556V3D4_BAGYA|nr:ATP-dependent DNA helicase Q1 [Bagarius yarrelli]